MIYVTRDDAKELRLLADRNIAPVQLRGIAERIEATIRKAQEQGRPEPVRDVFGVKQ